MRFSSPEGLLLVAVGLASLVSCRQHDAMMARGAAVVNETMEEGRTTSRQLQAPPRNRWCDNVWTLTYRQNRQRLSRVNVKTGQWTERLPLKRYHPDRYADALAVDPRNNKIYTMVPRIDTGTILQEIIPTTGNRIDIMTFGGDNDNHDMTKYFGIAINSKGVMYVSHWDTSGSSAESGLWTIDLDTLAVTKLPHILGLPPRGSPWLPTVLMDIDFDPEDNLWALGYDDVLLKVNLQWFNATGMGLLRPRSRNIPDSTELRIMAISFHKSGKLYGIAGNGQVWNPRGMSNPPIYQLVQKKDGRYRTRWPSAENTGMDWALGAAFLCR